MNFMNKSLAEGKKRGKMGALGKIRALLLLVLDLVLAGSFFSLEMSVGRLIQKFRQVVQDFGAIAMDRGLNIIFLNKLADLLGIELLEL